MRTDQQPDHDIARLINKCPDLLCTACLRLLINVQIYTTTRVLGTENKAKGCLESWRVVLSIYKSPPTLPYYGNTTMYGLSDTEKGGRIR